jgi:hypothetical protein
MAKIKSVAGFDAKRPGILNVGWGDGVASTFDIELLSEAVVAQLTHHGLKQKLMDAHSGTYAETGSIAECRKVSEAVWENLLGGVFNSERSGTPWIIECLSELFDVEEDDAKGLWEKLDAKSQKATYRDPKVIEWKAKRDLARAGEMESTIDLGKIFAKK